MLTDEEVRQEITIAERGSDIHGLVEKIAFYLHIGFSQISVDKNWYDAQDILLRWSDHSARKELREDSRFGNQLTDLLNHMAYGKHLVREFWGDSGDSYGDWVKAQDELARQVLWQQSKIYIN